MSDASLFVAIALVCAMMAALGVAFLPRGVLLVVLILLRVLASVGASSPGGDLLPGIYISGGVALAAILALMLPSNGSLSPRLKTTAAAVVVAFTWWTLVAFFYFGLRLDFLNDLVRVSSLVAILLLAYRLGTESPRNIPRLVNYLVGIPALVLILGYGLQLSSTMNAVGRATGSFSHANQAGAYFAVGVLACIWGYWDSHQRMCLATSLLGLVALLLTQSLGALAALGVGAVVLFGANAKIAVGRRFGMILGGMAVLVILFFSIGASGRLSELDGANYGDAESDNSLDWRFVNWKLLAEIWWERSPIFGMGFGSTSDEIQPLGTAAHSILVQLLVETGIVGCVIALIFSLLLCSAILRRFGTSPEAAAAMAAICTVVVVHGLASNWLGYTSAQYLALFMVGSLLGLSRGTRTATEKPGRAQAHKLSVTRGQ